jgi:hypothetical protein
MQLSDLRLALAVHRQLRVPFGCRSPRSIRSSNVAASSRESIVPIRPPRHPRRMIGVHFVTFGEGRRGVRAVEGGAHVGMNQRRRLDNGAAHLPRLAIAEPEQRHLSIARR